VILREENSKKGVAIGTRAIHAFDLDDNIGTITLFRASGLNFI
jgi:hypothetical protein